MNNFFKEYLNESRIIDLSESVCASCYFNNGRCRRKLEMGNKTCEGLSINESKVISIKKFSKNIVKGMDIREALLSMLNTYIDLLVTDKSCKTCIYYAPMVLYCEKFDIKDEFNSNCLHQEKLIGYSYLKDYKKEVISKAGQISDLDELLKYAEEILS